MNGITVRFGRSIAGCRKATAALQRMPPRCVSWYIAAPSCSAPLKSSLRGSPASTAASTNARQIGLFERESHTVSGPPVPWNSSCSRWLSSDRLKYGSRSS